MRVSAEHFKRGEFACHCGCGFGNREGDVDPKLIEVLEAIRNEVSEYLSQDTPLRINSGCRCNHWNWIIGGAKESQHKTGRAADIQKPDGISYKLFAAICERHLDRINHMRGGIGKYKERNFIHIDVRKERRYWKG